MNTLNLLYPQVFPWYKHMLALAELDSAAAAIRFISGPEHAQWVGVTKGCKIVDGWQDKLIRASFKHLKNRTRALIEIAAL